MNTQRIGVLYRKSDYPGVFIRILVDAIDLALIVVLYCGILLTFFPSEVDQLTVDRVFLVCFLFAFAYLGPWKATGKPTLGYWLCRVKVVNAEGNRISFWQATGRAFFIFLGPVNYLIDLFWLYGETPRQALRDKALGSYFIKKSAIPESNGKIVVKILHVMGYRVRVEEIQKVSLEGG